MAALRAFAGLRPGHGFLRHSILSQELRRPPVHLQCLSCPGPYWATRASSTSASSTSSPSPINVQDLAEKAKLRLAPEEVESLQQSVTGIVDWFGQLKAADVADVEPAISAAVFSESGVDSLRKDEEAAFPSREEMLSEVPSRDGPYLKVPRIL